MDSEALLSDLTAEQQQAVQHVDGPLLIVAGPGSGKTRVITRRVAHLNRVTGVPIYSIMALTFTNKAAGEMQFRVRALGCDWPGRNQGWRLWQTGPMVCTFHSLGLRILSSFREQAGLGHNFTIYDSADQTKVIKEALKLAEISSTNFPPSAIHSAISRAKNEMLNEE